MHAASRRGAARAPCSASFAPPKAFSNSARNYPLVIRTMCSGSTPRTLSPTAIFSSAFSRDGPPRRRRRRLCRSEDQTARRHAGPGTDNDVADILHLITRGSAHLADPFRDPVHAVNISLAELSAMGIDRQAPADLDVALADEVFRLARLCESEGLELRQHEG